ncbi:hypothetical protein P171DRAFT_436399 [Karstenula rhodostoma CBS 690.94]|uniref:Uncharacterized protein n=1 Tax=Karstenula rhodostoma CBS 690.94 TaxID=1392251 RepID=A0A9P4U6F7_9PLEO|nr:hypothetical protein P171DRAFT_436399 [Karstenula rhodostoma CBS 690.94]
MYHEATRRDTSAPPPCPGTALHRPFPDLPLPHSPCSRQERRATCVTVQAQPLHLAAAEPTGPDLHRVPRSP